MYEKGTTLFSILSSVLQLVMVYWRLRHIDLLTNVFWKFPIYKTIFFFQDRNFFECFCSIEIYKQYNSEHPKAHNFNYFKS